LQGHFKILKENANIVFREAAPGSLSNATQMYIWAIYFSPPSIFPLVLGKGERHDQLSKAPLTCVL
jgi:hypothetical protein